jgi:two-component system NarL family sensor kinase
VPVVALGVHHGLLEPLTALLAICAVVASLAVVDIETSIFTDASFVPYLLAATYLGPAAAIALAITAEVVTWLARRYRKEAALINAFATAVPNGLAAWAIAAVGPPDGPLFLVTVAMIGTAALAANAAIVITLIGLLDGREVRVSLRSWPNLVAPFALNMLLALTAAEVYRDLGLAAVAVVLVLVWAFNYLVAQILLAREQAQRISELAESRRVLLGELLDAEERERRHISQALHDGPLQELSIARQDIAEAARDGATALARVDKALAATVRKLRTMVFDLYPRVLDRDGLHSALEAAARREAQRGGFTVDVKFDSTFADAYNRLLFSVAVELLRNVTKHAGANRVLVSVADGANAVLLTVADDGRGFVSNPKPREATAKAFGLSSIEQRVQILGGRLSIGRGRLGGAIIEVELPALPAGSSTSTQRPPAPQVLR